MLALVDFLFLWRQWRTQEKFLGFKVTAGLVGGPGDEAPGRQRIFKNLQNHFLRKLQKMHYFSLFFKEFKNPALHFREFGRKTQLIVVILIKFFDENSIWCK